MDYIFLKNVENGKNQIERLNLRVVVSNRLGVLLSFSDDGEKIKSPKLIANLLHQTEIHFKSVTLTPSGNVSTMGVCSPESKDV